MNQVPTLLHKGLFFITTETFSPHVAKLTRWIRRECKQEQASLVDGFVMVKEKGTMVALRLYLCVQLQKC